MRWGSRIALATASVLAGLLVLETAVRTWLALDPNTIEEAVVRPRPSDPDDLKLVDLIRLHRDPRVVYELRPNVRGRFLGAELSINALGMRDVERSFEKPEGTFRIASLGDSHAFGWGVTRDEAYHAVLERLLNERIEGPRFEVWNLGVPGYNTAQEVRALELEASRIRPDLVLINFVDNDMDLPNFLSEPPALWTLRESHLLSLVTTRWRVLRHEEVLPLRLVGVAPEERTKRYRMDPERIPERFRPIYGWENMLAAYTRLASLAEKWGIPAVVLFNPDDYRWRLRGHTHDARHPAARKLAEHCAANGYLVVDAQERTFGYLQENGLPSSAVWLLPTDSHTNPLRHRLVAEELFESLLAASALPGEPRRSGNAS